MEIQEITAEAMTAEEMMEEILGEVNNLSSLREAYLFQKTSVDLRSRVEEALLKIRCLMARLRISYTVEAPCIRHDPRR